MTSPVDPPTRARWRQIGPGIVVAATGVGAGDLVATLVAGSRYGYALLWAAVAGCVIKVALSEGVARYHLATGRTILAGWRSLGRWTGWFFGVYVILWGFIYGATAMSASALPLAALFPVLPLEAWAILSGLAGFVFVLFNRYQAFETAMKIMTGVMFVVMVGLAILVARSLGDVLSGLRFELPDGALFYTLGLIGGVGGTVTTAAYGYWIGAKGWRGPGWIPLMRLDNAVAYAMTGVFVVAMLIVGAELLRAGGIALRSGDRGLLDLGDVLADRFGRPIAVAFLVGFFATAFSSVIGVWHGMSLFFADWARGDRDPPADPERSPAFRAYLAWLTFPPMTLLFLGQPFLLVVTYGAFGALFMPFLAVTLLVLLNGRGMPSEGRSGWLSNAVLGIAALLFAAVAVQQIATLVG